MRRKLNKMDLFKAVKEGDLNTVKDLIKQGVNVNQEGKMEESALQHAAENGDLEMAKVLIDAGAKVNKTNRLQEIPLHYAADSCDYRMTEFLLNKGEPSDVHRTSKDGDTPLHFALPKVREAIKQEKDERPALATSILLVNRGANMEAFSEWDIKPIDSVLSMNGEIQDYIFDALDRAVKGESASSILGVWGKPDLNALLLPLSDSDSTSSELSSISSKVERKIKTQRKDKGNTTKKGPSL